ncbi:MAG TPA: helix-turn-helix transcriptional regulator [Bryobacteraceae bacterium]
MRKLLEQTKGKPVYPNLKLQMWRTGLRQNRLARMLNIDETNLSRIVNGFRKPGPELKERIAALLASDQEWLFEPGTSAAPTAPAGALDLLPKEERGS